MDFLIRIDVHLPVDMDPDARSRLLEAETAHGRALAGAGVIQGIWRVPGRLANVAIWRASDATALHAALTSLPLWLYMEIEVTALADHGLAVHTAFLGGGSGPA